MKNNKNRHTPHTGNKNAHITHTHKSRGTDMRANRLVQEYIHNHILKFRKRERAKHFIHQWNNVGEIIIVSVLGVASLIAGSLNVMFAGDQPIQDNTSFVYPLKQVSTVDCRTLYWEEIPSSCKIPLPIIKNADINAYKDSTIHKQIYTVLWAAPYKEGRNQSIGAHNGLDIATARGTPVFSIGHGEVTYAGRQNGYGNVIKIKYLFNGKIFHALYAHLDTIEVKQGDTVKQGQRIGGVGNTGTSFGALGGFHLHFELDKDNSGRPMYGYMGCGQLSKGHRTIIQEGLCRDELYRNSYDPLILLEQNRLGHPEKQSPSSVITTRPIESMTVISNDMSEHIPSSDIKDEIQKTQDTQDTKQDHIVSTMENENVHTIAPTTSSIQATTTPKLQRDLNTDGLSLAVDHFVSQHTITLASDLQESITRSTNGTITMNITDKDTGKPFNGVLPQSLSLVTSNTNIKVSPVSVQHVHDGVIVFTISAEKQGNTNLLLQWDQKTIARKKIHVQ